MADSRSYPNSSEFDLILVTIHYFPIKKLSLSLYRVQNVSLILENLCSDSFLLLLSYFLPYAIAVTGYMFRNELNGTAKIIMLQIQRAVFL